MRRLSPLQRAYWMGYRRAKAQMRPELDAMARRLDDEVAGLTDEMRAAREQMARRLDDEIAGLVDEMQGVRNEFHRLKAIEEAVAVERDSDMLLNERWLSLGPAGAPPGALPASSNCEIASSRYDPQGQGAGGEFRETSSSTTKVHFPWALVLAFELT
jgi:hypothetical protein